MRISDWSSDVCSSDLPEGGRRQTNVAVHEHHQIVRTRLAAHDRPQYLRHGAALAVATLVHVADLDPLRVAVVLQQLVQHVDVGAVRTDERLVGKECVRTCKSLWGADN